MIVRSAADGALETGRNVQSISAYGNGYYTVYSSDGTNFNGCVAAVDALADGASAYGIPTNDTIEVHTAGPSGNASPQRFSATVFC
jgi:hypothetical protein